ncbi:hypothetical protein OBBRIDRAFT_808482 [Obba rivulosa]|uniref:Uncharacterized protein n=1 Tax=Obba rivulosa TaxID=1052685 RepID=A0A8E2ARX5_9APHY|nr:hypothetical protein OBBRIDRAFT_808482 [Obba rivulosa]
MSSEISSIVKIVETLRRSLIELLENFNYVPPPTCQVLLVEWNRARVKTKALEAKLTPYKVVPQFVTKLLSIKPAHNLESGSKIVLNGPRKMDDPYKEPNTSSRSNVEHGPLAHQPSQETLESYITADNGSIATVYEIKNSDTSQCNITVYEYHSG